MRARAGEQVVYAMRDRLAHFGSYSGNASEFLPYFVHHLRMWTITLLRYYFNLTGVYSGSVFIELGTASATRSRHNFRNFMQRRFDDLSNTI